MDAPLVNQSLNGNISLPLYVAYLCQAYHHVRHTVPLLMATGARLSADKEWLRTAVAEYIKEEMGHEQWILSDIEACGYPADTVEHAVPNLATEVLVAYAYDTVQRVSPLGFFGMVDVLEGTSIVAADKAAEAIQRTLGLPDSAFSYLRSHGALDIEHVKFFQGLMNRIVDENEQQLIVHHALVFYRLFGDVLRSVAAEQVQGLAITKNTGASHAA
jgi:pyrroloquinoline quinone (PQQ) biosynthesis protein C